MMVWSLFIIGLMGLFFYNKIGSIIPMVVLPTTEIIEPVFETMSYFEREWRIEQNRQRNQKSKSKKKK